MRKFLLLIVFPSLLALSLTAQDIPKVLVFGGYQYLHAGNADGQNDGANTNGWNASAMFNVTKRLGIAADFSGNYKGSFSERASEGYAYFPYFHAYTYTFGPVLSLNSRRKINPSAHALFGGAHLSPNGCLIFGGDPSQCHGDPSYSGFAMMLGGA